MNDNIQKINIKGNLAIVKRGIAARKVVVVVVVVSHETHLNI